ncbi:MAG TPA: phosphoribosylglycinamide formyltransferase [Candidatus Nitrosocosmicus sp.]|nr:phosphoribosylglycinamide formyltransferase [Candidatus Nitrosocosmicus sp.]
MTVEDNGLDGQIALPRKEREIIGKPKVTVLISGNGSNLQEIIDEVENGSIDATLVNVISNVPEAYGLTRARDHGIPDILLPSRGKMRDVEARKAYESELLTVLDQERPDIIVLAGWMMIVGDELLTELQNREIVVMNLHPALLTPDASPTVHTSFGELPVIRGAHAIEEAYNLNLPGSGVTVHQVLPGQGYDVGPIILTKEVERTMDDTLDTWRKKIHEAEHEVLPKALNKVLGVISQNIDASKGEVLW